MTWLRRCVISDRSARGECLSEIDHESEVRASRSSAARVRVLPDSINSCWGPAAERPGSDPRKHLIGQRVNDYSLPDIECDAVGEKEAED